LTIRALAGVLLFCGEELLMMKRGSGRELSPGLWANIGGHVERNESAFPASAALRELSEETGIRPEQIQGLFLRYIVLQREGDELHVFYDFTASCTEKPPLLPNDEGELHWVPIKDVLSLDMPESLCLLLRHYFSKPFEKKTLVGIMGNKAGVPEITWHTL
jgi:8-oxo-dGTP diphosphatase